MSKVSEKLSIEIRKLEVRLDALLRNEEAFVKELHGAMERLKKAEIKIDHPILGMSKRFFE